MALGEAYPLSQMMMFSVPEAHASRVIVREADGSFAEISAFEAWSCPIDLDLSGRCSPGFSAQDELAMEIIRQRRGDGGGPVTLVRRVFRIEPGGQRRMAVEECDLAVCRAQRRQP